MTQGTAFTKRMNGSSEQQNVFFLGFFAFNVIGRLKSAGSERDRAESGNDLRLESNPGSWRHGTVPNQLSYCAPRMYVYGNL